jgi:tetratricopeptide (TPR) repeat protein
MQSLSPRFASVLVLLTLLGCADNEDEIRQLQSQQRQRVQTQAAQDHLGETFALLARLVELNPAQAERQIVYHLNRWREGKTVPATPPSPLLKTVSDVFSSTLATERIKHENFVNGDLEHLRNAYVFDRVVRWIDHPRSDDPLLADWINQQEQRLTDEAARQLRTAARLFDWTVRNVAYEPMQLTDPAPAAPEMSPGLVFRGGGYRQTDYQALWRGTGDAMQRAAVFTQLCRQVSIPAFLLALQPSTTAPPAPWAVGTLIGDEVYLFEPELGSYIPGPDSVGIATLREARQDKSVLRRLNIPGFFEYPLTSQDIQQSVALLNVLPEAISPRMQLLQSGLTGDRRMVVYQEVDRLAAEIDDVSGIAGVRFWHIPYLAEIYQRDIQAGIERDPMLMFWYQSQWSIMDAPVSTSQQLSLGRWRHLHGEFDGDERENREGARQLYLRQRAPEFEIADLPINVDLQQAYGIRRDAQTTNEVFNYQIQVAQQQMRLGKQTATYWISLIHYDDQRFDTAETWLTHRVLAEEHSSQRWDSAARYNLARTLEQLGRPQEAIEIYKTEGQANEHGNRLRARLVSRGSEDPDDALE